MIEIDGSRGEGGGQIIRSALSLSVITQKAFRIKNIRVNRNPPGLQNQHLMAVLSTQKICGANVEGAELNSQELIFQPGKIQGGNYLFDVTTAGSTLLVLQTLLPILIFADRSSTVEVVGGTCLPHSPNYDYFNAVFLPAIRRFGVTASSFLHQSGYYPRGGGRVEMTIEPSKLNGCSDWDNPDTTHSLIRVGRLPTHIAEREKIVLEDAHIQAIQIVEETTFSPGNSLTLWQGFRGCCTLGVRGKKAEDVALEAVNEFTQEKGPIDVHLADQLLIYAALAVGESQYATSQFSSHLYTNCFVISKFLPRTIILNDPFVQILNK